jgi:hypothetical protein
MSRWKFWEKPPEPPTPEPKPEPQLRVRPRTDVLAVSPNLDPEQASRLRRLRQRRASVLYDVERAEEAARPENQWTQRIALVDETIKGVQADLAALDAERVPAGAPLPSTPIEQIDISIEPPPSVSFTIGDQRFEYSEDLDWAERGAQIARSELILRSGDIEKLIPSAITGDERDRIAHHLAGSLFAFATDLRDRAIDSQPLPENPTLADLAKPSAEHGGWLDWTGESPEETRRDLKRAEHAAELELFRAEQAREREERARWEDRLPIARRRLAEIDAEINTLLATK